MRWLVVLALLPFPALAEPIAGTGYLTTCIDDSCEIVIGGVGHWVVAGNGTDTDLMINLYEASDGVSPVAFSGETHQTPDQAPELELSSLTFLPIEAGAAALTAVQGVWQSDAADMPFTVQLRGLLWRERQDGKLLNEYRIFFGNTCADGLAQDGTVLSLRPTHQDMPEVACWQIRRQDDSSITLRQIAPVTRDVAFKRR